MYVFVCVFAYVYVHVKYVYSCIYNYINVCTFVGMSMYEFIMFVKDLFNPVAFTNK